jgi:hypothetical protein
VEKKCELEKAGEKSDCERLKSSEIAASTVYEVGISNSRQALLDSKVNPIPTDIKRFRPLFFSFSP